MLTAYLVLSLMHADLRPDLPAIEECQRLPDVASARAAIDRNDVFLAYVKSLAAVTPPEEEWRLTVAFREATEMRMVWVLILQAHGANLEEEEEHDPGAGVCWTEAGRRQQLAYLRDLVGPEAWVTGQFGVGVPLHRLPRLDR